MFTCSSGVPINACHNRACDPYSACLQVIKTVQIWSVCATLWFPQSLKALEWALQRAPSDRTGLAELPNLQSLTCALFPDPRKDPKGRSTFCNHCNLPIGPIGVLESRIRGATFWILPGVWVRGLMASTKWHIEYVSRTISKSS